MANLKETRNRIVSIKSTMQITSAMKMVSAAKLKRAQDAITKMRPYAQKLQEILVNLSADSSDSNQSEYTKVREVKKVLLIPITSNRGLCGGFNANIIKTTLKAIQYDYAGKEISIYAIGKKSGDWFRSKGYKIVKSEVGIFAELTFSNVSEIAQELMNSYVNGTYDEIVLIYNQFANAAVQHVQQEKFLPVSNEKQSESKSSVEYIYEPGKEDIILQLIPKSLKTQLFKALLDSVAGEHGARMTAMHSATDNASAMSKALTIEYNKARQAAITKEILEIVGGAEALNEN